MLEQILPKNSFSSYEDFARNFSVTVPARFNFAWDVVDAVAAREPARTALVWCNEQGEEATFTFGQMAEGSIQAANFFLSLGIDRGDPVMLVLKRRYEYWFCLLGLHRIGAIAIPATHLLTKKDIVYRNGAAGVKAIVCVNEQKVLENVDAALSESPTLEHRIAIGAKRQGWHDLNAGMANAGKKLGRMPTENTDTSLLYFTSGTTGMPKMVQHDFAYPLGHLVTAKYWQNVIDGGLHLTVADT
jgi:acetyl-CoA synthetase